MARFDLTNRDIGKLIIAAMLGFAALGFLGFGTINPNLARDFLILAGGLLTSETARQAIQTARSRGSEGERPHEREREHGRGEYEHKRQPLRNVDREREPEGSKDSKDQTE